MASRFSSTVQHYCELSCIFIVFLLFFFLNHLSRTLGNKNYCKIQLFYYIVATLKRSGITLQNRHRNYSKLLIRNKYKGEKWVAFLKELKEKLLAQCYIQWDFYWSKREIRISSGKLRENSWPADLPQFFRQKVDDISQKLAFIKIQEDHQKLNNK